MHHFITKNFEIITVIITQHKSVCKYIRTIVCQYDTIEVSDNYLKSTNSISLNNKYFLGRGLGAGDSTVIVSVSVLTAVL